MNAEYERAKLLASVPDDAAIFRITGRAQMIYAVSEFIGERSPEPRLDVARFISQYRNTTFGAGCSLLDQVDRFLWSRYGVGA